MVVCRIHFRRRFLPLAATLFAVLLGGAVARADCSDHSRPILPMEAGVLDRSTDPVRPPAPASDPRPCTGPSCSRQPAQTVATPAPDRIPPESGLDLRRPVPLPAAAGPSLVAGPEPGYRAPFAAPLVRPPRP